MTITDTGPLVALLDVDDRNHERCATTLRNLERPLVTTWPVFTEAMHFGFRLGGQRGTRALWGLVSGGRLTLVDLPAELIDRSAALMTKYADVPMDLADATLVALAEHRKDNRIFTLDSDFHVYRLNGRRQFDVVPR